MGTRPRRPAPILIVDDNRVLAGAMCEVLAAAGHPAEAAFDPAAALARIERGDVGLVLLDLRLGDDDGRELLARIRGRPGGAAVPVLLLSGSPGAAEDLSAAGERFLLKPVEAEVLVVEVRRALAARPLAR